MPGDQTTATRVPARAKGRPSLEQASAIDQAIREAAIRVLLDHGEAATLNAVAHVAGLSRKSVYARYPGKEALFIEVIRDMLAGASGVDYDHGGTAEERLCNYLQSALALIATPHARSIQRLLMLNPGYLTALKVEMRAAVRRHFYVPLLDLLVQADASGELVVGDVEATTQVLLKLVFAESLGGDEDGDRVVGPVKRADYARFVTRLVTRGILPRS
ncbi:MAG: TetR/AcrR family transcriptional regulator [Sphingomonadales bacterium]|nr:TetR/AcrR family transcriptional regulator [Sphingomonadales bacterium]